MRVVLTLSLIAIAATACASPSAPTTTLAKPAPARSTSADPLAVPTWQVGDRWVYDWTSGSESGSKTIEVVDSKTVNGVPYYVVRLGDAEHYYTRELHWAAAIRDGKVEARMVPPQRWFVWPLAPGAQWTYDGRFEQHESVVTFNDRFVVGTVESVEVPAGRYDALKVARETTHRDSDEYWYASEVRWYVRWLGRRGDSQFTERLREYRPASRTR